MGTRSLGTVIYLYSCFLEVCAMGEEGCEPDKDPGFSCLCERVAGSEIWANFGVAQTLGLAWFCGVF